MKDKLILFILSHSKLDWANHQNLALGEVDEFVAHLWKSLSKFENVENEVVWVDKIAAEFKTN